MPSPLARSIRRSVDSRTWPTLPAAPSSSSTVAVWIESTTTRPGRSARARLDDPPDVVLGEDLDPLPGRPAQQPEPCRAQPDLARRFLAGGVQDRARRRRSGRGRPRPGAGASTCRSPARHRPGPASPGTSPPPRTRSSSSIPRRRRGRSASAMPASGSGAAAIAGPRRDRPFRARRLADDGLDQACSSRRTRGTALPSAGTPPRRTGRRSGSGAAPSSLGRRTGGAAHRASTGVRGSARWMSRPASGSLSTTIVDPGSYLPSRRCSARTSSIMFWMTRRSGRAP